MVKRIIHFNMLSIVIITFNEADIIEQCLQSIDNFGDEIIIIDSYSTDNTTQIAKKYGAKIYERALDSFAEQRNFALKHVQGTWVLYLDADEIVTADFKKEVQDVINQKGDNAPTGYFIRRDTYYFGKRWGFIDQLERLFLVKNFSKWTGVVHETAHTQGLLGVIQSPIKHFTHRNLTHMVAKTNKWSEYEAELRYKAHHPRMTTFRFMRILLTGFFRSYINDRGYKNGTAGFIESIYQAFSLFITYAKLWEKQQKT